MKPVVIFVLLGAVLACASTAPYGAVVGPDVAGKIAEAGEAGVIVIYRPHVSIASGSRQAMANMSVDAAGLEALRRDPGVAGIYYNYPVRALLQDTTGIVNSTV